MYQQIRFTLNVPLLRNLCHHLKTVQTYHIHQVSLEEALEGYLVLKEDFPPVLNR